MDTQRQELERLWRSRVDLAKLRYEVAHAYLQKVQHAPEYANAVLAEREAQAEFFRVLRVFQALLTEGKIPDEGEWGKAAGGEV